MLDSLENKILTKIKKAKRGTPFFGDDFIRFGSSKTVVDKGDVSRVARGIYSRLMVDPILGEINPTIDAIAKSIAKRDRARIVPTGVLALNALGLSTQVPMNVVYLTDGSARKINLGKRGILFKRTSPKNLSTIGNITPLVIQALKEIGKDNATDEEIKIILSHLEKEDSYRLEHDIRFAPEWIRIIMRKAQKTHEDE